MRISFRLLVAAMAMSTTVVYAQSPVPVSRTPVPGAPAGVTAVMNVAVVPMDTERVLADHTVLVQNGWITAVGPSQKVPVPAGAVRIDGRGKYLVPGLADMHAHLTQGISSLANDLFLWAANGVTTIRSMDLADPSAGDSLMRLRARVVAGELWSPRIYVSAGWRKHRRSSDTAQRSVATTVAAIKAAGYDLIKVRDESPDLFDSVAAEARRLGLPFAGHVSGLRGGFAGNPERLERVLSSGIASIEHLTGYLHYLTKGTPQQTLPQDSAERYSPAFLAQHRQRYDFTKIPQIAAATKRAGVWNTPSQLIYEIMGLEARSDTMADWPELQLYPAELRERVRHEKRAGQASGEAGLLLGEASGDMLARRQLIKTLQDSGAGLLLGVDVVSLPLVRGFSVHRELEMLMRAGLTPYQALATGTRNVAQYFGTLDSSGMVAAGKRADLVLLNGNPLQDIRNTRQPMGVMLGGRWLARAEIDRRLTDIKASLTASP